MAFDSSGVYTRVDNSFSNPVVGTTINPSHADTYFDDIDTALNAYRGTSTTSLAIGTGAKVFTTQTGKLFTEGRFILATSDADETNYMFGQVTTYTGTALTVNVTSVGGSGTLADWTIYNSSPRGAAGTTGSAGSTGAAGATVGVQFTYSTTTTDSDPGAGVFRFNNATIASVTAGYFDNADAGGSSVTAWLDTFDDSTNTAKGTLVCRGVTSPTAWAVFSVTSTVVDGTGYRKLTLTHVASGGTFTNAETFAFHFSRAGDKGADGAGTGDVVGPASATASAMAEFNGTTGKLIKDGGVVVSAYAKTVLDDADAAAALATLTARGQGKETIWLPATAMISATTNGPSTGTVEQTTNKNMTKTLDFDTTTSEIAQFHIAFPKSWNLGTVTFIPHWTAASGSGTVIWALSGVAISNDDALDVAFGTAQSSTDTLITAYDNHVGPESSAITIAGTPAVGDLVNFKLVRDVSDTLGVDAKLIGIQVFFTTNAATDV